MLSTAKKAMQLRWMKLLPQGICLFVVLFCTLYAIPVVLRHVVSKAFSSCQMTEVAGVERNTTSSMVSSVSVRNEYQVYDTHLLQKHVGGLEEGEQIALRSFLNLDKTLIRDHRNSKTSSKIDEGLGINFHRLRSADHLRMRYDNKTSYGKFCVYQDGSCERRAQGKPGRLFTCNSHIEDNICINFPNDAILFTCSKNSMVSHYAIAGCASSAFIKEEAIACVDMIEDTYFLLCCTTDKDLTPCDPVVMSKR